MLDEGSMASGDEEEEGRLLLDFSATSHSVQLRESCDEDAMLLTSVSQYHCEHGRMRTTCKDCGRDRCLGIIFNGPLGAWAREAQLNTLWQQGMGRDSGENKRQKHGYDNGRGSRSQRAKTTPLRGVHRTSDSGWGAKFNKYRVSVDGSITHTDRPVVGAKQEVNYIKVTKEEMLKEADRTGAVTWYTLMIDGTITTKQLPFGEKDPTPKTLSTPREAGLAYDKALKAARPAKFAAMRNFHPDSHPAPDASPGLYFTMGMRYENPLALRSDELRSIICPKNAPKNSPKCYSAEALAAEAEALIASIPQHQKNDPDERQKRHQKKACRDCSAGKCERHGRLDGAIRGYCKHGQSGGRCPQCSLEYIREEVFEEEEEHTVDGLSQRNYILRDNECEHGRQRGQCNQGRCNLDTSAVLALIECRGETHGKEQRGSEFMPPDHCPSDPIHADVSPPHTANVAPPHTAADVSPPHIADVAPTHTAADVPPPHTADVPPPHTSDVSPNRTADVARTLMDCI
jgi:hypothetical protein